MATVSSNNLIAVLPEYLDFVRGQAQSGTITLYQNYVGNSLNVGTTNDVTLKIYDDQDNLIKTYNKVAGTLTYGVGSTNSEGRVHFELTEQDTLAMAKGDVWAQFILAFPINTYTLPKLLLGRTFDAGDMLSSGYMAGRFTVPAPVYTIKSFNYGTDLPALGEVVFNGPNPAGITKMVFNNQDDRGIRNAYLEAYLLNRFGQDGINVNLSVTNTRNASKYAIYKVVSWQRVEILDDGNNSDAEYTDGIELTLQYEGHSRTSTENLAWLAGDSIGMLLESYSAGTVGIADSNGFDQGANKITFSGGATITTDGNGGVNVSIPTFDSSSGTINGEDGSSGTSGTSGNNGLDGTDGADGADGADGSSGTSGTSGNDGAQGPQGDPGTSGTSGNDGAQGPAGADGSSGTSGNDGAQGPAGNDGADGSSGTSGTSGNDGAQGPAGNDGADGADGSSGTSGTSGNDGAQGPQGDPGTSGTSGTSGTNGSSGINGAKGDQGDTGTSGTSGNDGAEGAPGTSGTSGTNGSSGVNGPQGDPGTSGTSGTNGEQGLPGTSGTSGTSGSSGANGTSGTSGTSATSGTSGTSGNTGTSGTSGNDGAPGTSGTSGNDGAEGAPGTSGTSGTSGNDGAEGAPGTSGTSGSSGANGTSGTSGTSATSGTSGTSGDTGTSGTSGTSGSNGNDGLPGTSGTSGAKGDQGDPGTSGTSGTNGEQGLPGTSGTSGTNGSSGINGSAGTSGTSGTSGSGLATGGTSGQVLVKASSTDFDTTWADPAAGGGSSVTKYLLRLEYDANNHLVNNTTQNTFVAATGFVTSGASVNSVAVNTSTAIYSATIQFANESNPPQGILVYAWQPDTYKYEVHPYRIDSGDLKIDTTSSNFTSSSFQYTPDMFSSFGSSTITIDVRQSYIKYGGKTGGLGSFRYPHAYLVFVFNA